MSSKILPLVPSKSNEDLFHACDGQRVSNSVDFFYVGQRDAIFNIYLSP